MPSQPNFVRIRSLGAFVLVALLLVTSVIGCSQTPSASSSETASPSASPSSSSSAAESAPSAPETRVFTDGLGREVEIPVHPQRVVVSEFSSQALTVGVKPIGLGPNDLKNAFTQAQLTDIDDVGDPPNAEKILDLKPDLIIFSQYMPEIYPDAMAQIEKIAPVVYIAFEDPIYDVLTTVADALGKRKRPRNGSKATRRSAIRSEKRSRRRSANRPCRSSEFRRAACAFISAPISGVTRCDPLWERRLLKPCRRRSPRRNGPMRWKSRWRSCRNMPGTRCL